jgi:MYXO-CTERM domain-containing protein
MKPNRSILYRLAFLAFPLGLAPAAHAAVFFWDNGGAGENYNTPGNWSPDGIPGAADLAVHNNGSNGVIQITQNQSADSLRLTDGGSVNHTGGTLTIANGAGGDNGLWVGEFGPGQSTYTLSGGTITINDANDGFMVGRAGNSNGVFNFNSGVVSATIGDTHVGLDGVAAWNQSSGTFNGAGVHIGRFQSPTATVALSGNAIWTSNLVLLSDSAAAFSAAIESRLSLTGPSVNYLSNGLVVRSKGNIDFDGSGGGISTMFIGSEQLLLDDGRLNLFNLPTPMSMGQEITLIANIGSYTGQSQFQNAPDGTNYSGWELDYRSNSIVLVSTVPEPSAALLGALGMLALLRRRR